MLLYNLPLKHLEHSPSVCGDLYRTIQTKAYHITMHQYHINISFQQFPCGLLVTTLSWIQTFHQPCAEPFPLSYITTKSISTASHKKLKHKKDYRIRAQINRKNVLSCPDNPQTSWWSISLTEPWLRLASVRGTSNAGVLSCKSYCQWKAKRQITASPGYCQWINRWTDWAVWFTWSFITTLSYNV